MNAKLIGLALAVLVVSGGALYFQQTRIQSQSVSNANDQDIRNTVTEFGSQFKEVSLLAPDAADQIANVYEPYITPELLSAWKADPNKAPGRQTSSPWPESLYVVAVTPAGEGTYKVDANVIEVTSANPNQPAAVYPVVMMVKKIGTLWVVFSFERGAYSELPH